jgi:hypothetical protein
MGASAHHLLRMVESIRKPYMEAAVRYLGSIQDPETGLWGEGSLYIRISGTFKLRALYRAIGADIPNVDRIYQTILDCLRNEKAIDMCWVRNPIDLLSSFEGRHVVPDEELAEILEITFTNLRCFLKSDGGFSREIGSSPPAPNVAQVKEGEFYPYMPLPVRIGKGLTEGDMNAGTQAIWIRIMCHKLAGLDVLPLTAYTVDFWQNVMARSGRNIMNLKFRQGLTDSGC